MCRDDMLLALSPHKTLEETTERVTQFDFDNLEASSPADIRKLFSTSFAFGCEADDPMTKLAFDRSLTKTRLRVTLGSDIAHWDVVHMDQVLVEAYELVDHGLIDEKDFRDLVFTNALYVHGALNPHILDGTRIEDESAQELGVMASERGLDYLGVSAHLGSRRGLPYFERQMFVEMSELVGSSAQSKLVAASLVAERAIVLTGGNPCALTVQLKHSKTVLSLSVEG